MSFPNKATQFQLGVSGNPAGRPRGSLNRATVLKKWTSVKLELRDPVTGERVPGTIEDEVVLALLAKARAGDVAAIREVLDGLYGKPVQPSAVVSREISGPVSLSGLRYRVPRCSRTPP